MCPLGETLRHLISKAILRVTRDDILKAVGSIQLCAGQEAVCEAGIHAMRNLFEDEGAEMMLMVNASNAFNSLNREAALRNTRILCPVLAPMLTNMYRSHSMLFIDGDHILSQEGTTQGDPLAMAMYALPLIRKLHGNVTQVWYADDASAGGRTSDLCVWWDSLVSYGPRFGYNPNPCKTWLVVKPEHLPAAEEHFQGSGVNITIQGHRYLGAPLGSKSFVEDFIRDKISCWGSEIRRLSEIPTSGCICCLYPRPYEQVDVPHAHCSRHRTSLATIRGSNPAPISAGSDWETRNHQPREGIIGPTSAPRWPWCTDSN